MVRVVSFRRSYCNAVHHLVNWLIQVSAVRALDCAFIIALVTRVVVCLGLTHNPYCMALWVSLGSRGAGETKSQNLCA